LQAYKGRRKTTNVNDLLRLNRHCKQNISNKSKQLMETAVAES